VRDDIHKGAPFKPYWRWLIRACERDADWQQKGTMAARKALAGELLAQEGLSFVGRLRGSLAAPQLSLAPDIEAAVDGASAGLPLSAVQHRIRLHLRMAPLCPGAEPESIVRAVSLALSEVRDAFRRDFDAYLAINFSRDRRTMMQRIIEVLASVPTEQWAADVVAGVPPSFPSRLAPLTLDSPIV
jgi:hypothetical protein